MVSEIRPNPKIVSFRITPDQSSLHHQILCNLWEKRGENAERLRKTAKSCRHQVPPPWGCLKAVLRRFLGIPPVLRDPLRGRHFLGSGGCPFSPGGSPAVPCSRRAARCTRSAPRAAAGWAPAVPLRPLPIDPPPGDHSGDAKWLKAAIWPFWRFWRFWPFWPF